MFYAHPYFWGVCSGILLALSFPKFNLFFLAWFALVPFIAAVRKSKKPFTVGYIFGLTFFSINLFWILTLTDYVGFWAVCGYLLLILFQALFFGFAANLIDNIFNHTPNLSILLIPVAWCFFEWLRTLPPEINLSFMSGFIRDFNILLFDITRDPKSKLPIILNTPWKTILTQFGISAGGVGYSQTAFRPLIQIATLFSGLGVSFFVLYVNTLLEQIHHILTTTQKRSKEFKKKRIIKIAEVLLISIILYVSFGFHLIGNFNRIEKKSISPTISIIQGNIDQKTKLSSKHTNSNFLKYEKLTKQAALKKPDIILWTETSVTSYLLRNDYLYNRISRLARSTAATLIIGTPTKNNKNQIFNSLIAFSEYGEDYASYNKEHLVAFGEYLPFRDYIYPLFKKLDFFKQEFTNDPKVQLITVDNLVFGPLICFESTLPYLSYNRVKLGANILLNVTNDAWFKNSSALEQHLQMGIMRAVENRRYFIQAANTGISAVIDPTGAVLMKSKPNREEILTFSLKL
ncbi:apolipoprotein N-acyltransferase [Candidatus Margulisiibacteriota bacterium]